MSSIRRGCIVALDTSHCRPLVLDTLLWSRCGHCCVVVVVVQLVPITRCADRAIELVYGWWGHRGDVRCTSNELELELVGGWRGQVGVCTGARCIDRQLVPVVGCADRAIGLVDGWWGHGGEVGCVSNELLSSSAVVGDKWACAQGACIGVVVRRHRRPCCRGVWWCRCGRACVIGVTSSKL